MGEEAQPEEGRAKLYLRLIKRPSGAGMTQACASDPTLAYVQGSNRDRARDPIALSLHPTVTRRSTQGCLISPSDAAISNRLKDDIKVVLAVLTPREERVLRARFGLGEIDHAHDDWNTHAPRISDRVLLQALRKLRRPGGPAKRIPRV